MNKKNLSSERELNQISAIMAAASDAIVVINPEGLVTEWNRAAERIFGYTREEIIGISPHTVLMPEKYREAQERAFHAFKTSGTGSAVNNMVELNALRKDGTVFPVEMSLASFHNEAGWNAVGVIRDISKRKASELALQEDERKLRELFEGMPIALYRTRHNGTILDANKAMWEMLGYSSKSSILSLNAAEFYIDLSQRTAFHEELDRNGTVRNMPLRLRRRDNAEIAVLISARAVFDSKGEIEYFEGSLRDITEDLKAETEKKRRERLEVASQLAAGIAHDFNNILAGIRGFAEYLAISPKHDEKVRNAGERILLAANRAAKIVDGLLTTLGTQTGSNGRVCLDEVVLDAINQLHKLIPADARIRIGSELSCGDLEIQADGDRLKEALSELLKNAVAAAEGNGQIRVRSGVGRVEPAWVFAPQGELSGTWAWVSVVDTGCGMTEAVLDRAFEPYFTTAEFGKGAGLGLTKVLGIARQHKGFVGISSHAGQGTTVTFYLPL